MIGRVLIADDEFGVRESLSAILKTLHYEADIAEDGLEANALMSAHKYDFVFLDINMPGLTGIELLKRYRKKLAGTIIIIMSGYTYISEYFPLSLGAQEYIEKPFSVDDIGYIINKYSSAEVNV